MRIEEGSFTSSDPIGYYEDTYQGIYDSYSFEAEEGETVSITLEGTDETDTRFGLASILLYYATFDPNDFSENVFAGGIALVRDVSETLAQSGAYHIVVWYQVGQKYDESDVYDGMVREYTLTWTLE